MPLEKSSDQHNDSIKPNEDKPESVPPKPQILYHGSPNGTITELEPRVAKGSKELGPLVFASDKVSSIAYLAHHHGLALVSQFYEERESFVRLLKRIGTHFFRKIREVIFT